jgi:hypothetical protein
MEEKYTLLPWTEGSEATPKGSFIGKAAASLLHGGESAANFIGAPISALGSGLAYLGNKAYQGITGREGLDYYNQGQQRPGFIRETTPEALERSGILPENYRTTESGLGNVALRTLEAVPAAIATGGATLGGLGTIAAGETLSEALRQKGYSPFVQGAAGLGAQLSIGVANKLLKNAKEVKAVSESLFPNLKPEEAINKTKELIKRDKGRLYSNVETMASGRLAESEPLSGTLKKMEYISSIVPDEKTKKPLTDTVQAINKLILENGKINANDLWEIKKSVNRYVSDPDIPNAAKFLFKSLGEDIKTSFSKLDPKFFANLSQADALHTAEKAAEFVVSMAPKRGIVERQFKKVGSSLKSSAKYLSDPVIQKNFVNVLKSAAEDSKAGIINNGNKLIKAMQVKGITSEEPKEYTLL